MEGVRYSRLAPEGGRGMSRNVTVAAAIAFVLLAACGKATSSSSVSPSAGSSPTSVTGNTGTTIHASGAVPTSSPGISGAVSRGDATITLSAGVPGEVSFGQLGTPAIWSPPPGAIALRWITQRGEAFGVGGASFTGTQTTSGALSLSFTVKTNGGTTTFHSIAGECEVTISQAGAHDVAGLFTCTGLTSTDGKLT